MKRIIAALFIIEIGISLSAQDKHLEITQMMGKFIITGTVDDFKSSMDTYFNVGAYSVIETNNDINCTLLKGVYMGNPDCIIGLFTTPITNTIYQVCIDYQSYKYWASVQATYTTLRTFIEKEYGKPTYIKEYFLAPYKNGDGYEIEAFNLQKASYNTLWKTDNGAILLTIVSDGTQGTVEIIFQDKTGKELLRQEEIDIKTKQQETNDNNNGSK